IGSKLMIDGNELTVIGIMPPEFQFPAACELWIPLGLSDQALRSEDGSTGLEIIARLGQGITLPQAQAAMDVIARQLGQQHPETNTGRGIKLIRFRDGIRREKKITVHLAR